ncbi:MAG: radical SAM protein, partial [Gemmataceae bacterium]
MLAKLAYRTATELKPRIAAKAAHLWVFKGMLAVNAYRSRLRKKDLYPPFMFIALTNTCNLRCQGCWVEKEGEAYHLPAQDLDNIIHSCKRMSAYYYTLLGGEPYMYKGIWDIFNRHKDCYFQTITNGMLFTERNADRVAEAGNITPLISIDGAALNNDKRRGEGVYDSALKGMERLKQRGVLFGTACTITKENLDEVLCDKYLEDMIRRGCMYIWYYVYRPVGEDPHPEYCLSPDDLIEARRRLVALRHK